MIKLFDVGYRMGSYVLLRISLGGIRSHALTWMILYGGVWNDLMRTISKPVLYPLQLGLKIKLLVINPVAFL